MVSKTLPSVDIGSIDIVEATYSYPLATSICEATEASVAAAAGQRLQLTAETRAERPPSSQTTPRHTATHTAVNSQQPPDTPSTGPDTPPTNCHAPLTRPRLPVTARGT